MLTNCENINLDQFCNGSKLLENVAIHSKNISTEESNVSMFSEAVVGALFDAVAGSVVGACFCANNQSGSLNKHGISQNLSLSSHEPSQLTRAK